MRKHRYGVAVAAAVLVISTAGAARAEAPPRQEQQQEAAISQRVTELEAALALLRAEYGARLVTIEAQIAELRAAAPAPTLEAVTGGEAAGQVAAGQAVTEVAGVPEAGMSAEERAELERQLAELLGAPVEGTGGGPAPDRAQGGERRFQSQNRNLNELNPEISATGDVSADFTNRDGPDANQVSFNEFEVALQAALDPYSSAKFFFVQEGGEFRLEEGYIEYNTLPAGLGVKVGQIRLDWGKLNRWHKHALPQADLPAVNQAIWGEEGLTGLGGSVSWVPTPFLGDFNEVIVQVVNDDNDVSFSGRGFGQPVFLVHETNYFDISPASYVEIGISAATATNDLQGEFRTQVYGTDWNFNWAPPATALYRGFELRGEFLWQRRETATGFINSVGTYTYGTYKLNRRAYVGLRGDYTQLPKEPGESLWGMSPYFDWWQSEWVRLRFQYGYSSRRIETPKAEHRFFLQLTWAIGPHKHEKY